MEDTGCGIPKESQERIFEPLFTTKPEGLDTGLGLVIVKHMGGEIRLRSVVGRGTTFEISLPPAKKNSFPLYGNLGVCRDERSSPCPKIPSRWTVPKPSSAGP